MAYLNNSVMDNGLNWLIANGTRFDICSASPVTYADVVSYSLGYKNITLTGPSDLLSGGRKVTIPFFNDGLVTVDGTSAYWAITNGSDTLLATSALNSTDLVYTGNNFSIQTFDIGIPGPA